MKRRTGCGLRRSALDTTARVSRSASSPSTDIFGRRPAKTPEKGWRRSFVLLLEDGSLAGYYTLSSTAVKLPELPETLARKLPRYPLVPATLLGRLAIDRRHRGKGCGRFLLADALYRALRSEIASFAVIVEAKDENAKQFYLRESFLPFPDRPKKLFRPMADIEALFR